MIVFGPRSLAQLLQQTSAVKLSELEGAINSELLTELEGDSLISLSLQLQADVVALTAALQALTAKLDLDTGVADTDYNTLTTNL